MRIEQFEAILATAECHSMQKAAEKLYTTSQNISKLIKDFEKEFRVSVFTRNRHGVFPTEDGAYIVEELTQVMNRLTALKELYTDFTTDSRLTVASSDKAVIDTIRILSIPSNDIFISSMLDYLKARFSIQNALFDFHDAMWIYNTLESDISQLQNYDLIFTNVLDYQLEYLKQHCAPNTVFLLFKNRFGIHVSKEHKLSSYESVSIKDLLDEDLIVHISDGMTTTMHLQALQNLGCALKPKYIIKSQKACMTLIKKNVGISIINFSNTEDDRLPKETVMIPLKEKIFSYHILLVNPSVINQPYYSHIQNYIIRHFKYCQLEN